MFPARMPNVLQRRTLSLLNWLLLVTLQTRGLHRVIRTTFMYIFKPDFHLGSGADKLVGSNEDNAAAKGFKDLDISGSKFQVH